MENGDGCDWLLCKGFLSSLQGRLCSLDWFLFLSGHLSNCVVSTVLCTVCLGSACVVPVWFIAKSTGETSWVCREGCSRPLQYKVLLILNMGLEGSFLFFYRWQCLVCKFNTFPHTRQNKCSIKKAYCFHPSHYFVSLSMSIFRGYILAYICHHNSTVIPHGLVN